MHFSLFVDKNFETKKSTITTESQPLPVEKKTCLSCLQCPYHDCHILGPATTRLRNSRKVSLHKNEEIIYPLNSPIHQGFSETPTLYIIPKCFEPLKLPWCFFQRHLPTTFWQHLAVWIDKNCPSFFQCGTSAVRRGSRFDDKEDRVSPDQVLQGGPPPVKSD